MTNKTYTGTKQQILEQLKTDLNFKPMDDRYKDDVTYPFNSDGLSDATFEEQLNPDEFKGLVFWMEFIQDDKGDVFGTMQSAKGRILKS